LVRLLRAVCFAATLGAAATSLAATYYVRSGGDDSNDGRSHASAWATLDKIKKHAFQPGDDVFFLEGDRWVGQLLVDWPGTADNPAIIGAYHLENGAAIRGFQRERPVIDGADTIPQQFDGLVRIRANYARIENLAVNNSEGRGIQFEDSDHGAVIDCVTTNSYKSGIKVLGSDDSIVMGNLVVRAGVASPEDGGVWGGAIELVGSDNGIIRENTVSEVYGEGINVNHGSANSVIEDNYVFAARAVGIYVDAAPNSTVRRNVVVGTSDPEFWRGDSASGTGIALNNEEYHYLAHGGDLPSEVQSRGAKIYNNLVAATNAGIGFWGQFAATSFDDVLVFNNTFVDNDVQLVVRDKPKPGALFTNNVLLSITAGTRDVDKSDLAGMTASSNYFSQGDPGGTLRSSKDIHQGLALARMSDWRAASNRTQLTWQDFQVRDGSSIIGAGNDAPRRLSQGGNTYDLDFNRSPHNAPMDMGALRFSSVAITTPKKPPRTSATP
jgi:hypothetical protein